MRLKLLLFATGILFIFSVIGAAQDNKQPQIKVTPDEAKAIKKTEEAKTLADKVKLTGEFIKKFPKSAARAQVRRSSAMRKTI